MADKVNGYLLRNQHKAISDRRSGKGPGHALALAAMQPRQGHGHRRAPDPSESHKDTASDDEDTDNEEYELQECTTIEDMAEGAEKEASWAEYQADKMSMDASEFTEVNLELNQTRVPYKHHHCEVPGDDGLLAQAGGCLRPLFKAVSCTTIGDVGLPGDEAEKEELSPKVESPMEKTHRQKGERGAAYTMEQIALNFDEQEEFRYDREERWRKWREEKLAAEIRGNDSVVL